ncbi:hypothetical protein VTJ04DRAFT_617 [Mycothermus thermophilus]|uniref:uncharacterized protein n=1 Tax=Humicola insolens TaxID=85995 RepID=UPI003743B359
MLPDTCCTCASLLSAASQQISADSEKPVPNKHLDCCGRIICGACTSTNPRFLLYCPFCQTSGRCPPQGDSRPGPLKSQTRPEKAAEAKEEECRGAESDESNIPAPPPYSPTAEPFRDTSSFPESSSPFTSPPAYTPLPTNNPLSLPLPPPSPSQTKPQPTKEQPQPEQLPPKGYILHHLRHPPQPNPDSLTSLSLAYGVPIPVLRKHNRIPPDADYLLAARHTVLIPLAYITTKPPPPQIPSSSSSESTATHATNADGTTPSLQLSLSPNPIDDEATRARKTALRRFMVAVREPDYDAAKVYLEDADWDVDAAVGRYLEDVAWEKAHPFPSTSFGGRGDGGARSRGEGRAGWWKRHLKGLN